MNRKRSRKIEALESLAARPGTDFEGAVARLKLAKELEKPQEKKERAEPRRDRDGLHKRRGVWYFSLNVNGRRRFYSAKTRVYKDAQKERTKKTEEQKAGQLPNDLSRLPFSELLAHTLKMRQHLSEGSRRIDRERSRPLLAFFGDQRASKITAQMIQDYQTRRLATDSRTFLQSDSIPAGTKPGPRTVNLEIRLLHTTLATAKIGWPVEVRQMKENRIGPGRALDEQQERMLFDVARSKPQWKPAFYAALAAANTTTRGVELKHLKIGDVNLIDGEIVVRRSKTDAGLRKIPLNAGAQWAFARLLERANALGSVEPDHFLFPHALYRRKTDGPRGIGYDPKRPQKTWRTAWRALVKATAREAGRVAAREAIESGRGWRAARLAWKRAAGGLRGLRFHDLRHCAVTKLAESQASDATIMSISGHMDRAMLELYSHVRSAARRAAVDGMRSYVPEEKKPVVTTETMQ